MVESEWPPRFEGWEFAGWATWDSTTMLFPLILVGRERYAVDSAILESYSSQVQFAYVSARGPLYRKGTP